MALMTGERIVKAHPYGFRSFMVVGPRGVGKSTYALRVLFEIYLTLGYDEKEAWKKALESCKFHIKDIIQFLRESTLEEESRPVLLWDDIGIHASGSKYFLNMKQADQLKGVLDAIRTAISGLIMTCPTSHGLLSMLNKYDDYKIVISYTNKGGNNRVATCYKWRTLPSGKRLISTQYKDEYSCHIPNPIFKLYMAERKKALIDTLDALGDGFKKEVNKHE